MCNVAAPRVSRGKKVKAGAEAAAAAAGADEAEVEAAGVTAAAQAAAARKLAKKKKKIRYPKNYNPDNPGTPDPERWLPRRCVSTGKPTHRILSMLYRILLRVAGMRV